MIIAAGVYYILYTSSGHERISSYLSKQVSHKIGQEVTLKIEDMALTPSHLDATVLINDTMRAEVEGFLSPTGMYDIQYRISGKKIAFAKVNFEDKFDVNGSLKGTMEAFHLRGLGHALDGKVDFSLYHDRKKERDIKVIMTKTSSAKVLQLLGKKPLLGGTFSLQADVPLYSEFEKNGDIALDIHRSGVYLRNIKELYGVLFPDDFMLWASAKVKLTNAQYLFDANVSTTAGELKLTQGKFLETNKKLNALYTVDITELSKLAFITKKRYRGAFLVQGEMAYQNGFRVDGESNSLDGKINYYYEKGNLEAGLQGVSLSKLFSAMAYPPIMVGNIEGKVDYDVAKNVALINIKSDNAHFKNSKVIHNIYRASKVDLSKEVFTKSYFASSVEEGIVSYDFRAENSKSYLTLFNTRMDSAKNTIESGFDLKMQGEELSGEIYGSLNSPRVKLDMGKYIEFKAKKEIDEFFGTGTTDKVKQKLKNVDMDDVKGFIKGVF